MTDKKIKALLKELNFRPSKRRGQNFLISGRLAQKIAAAIRKAPPPWVEIGPGLGSLTELFLKEKESLILIEADKKLAAYWKSKGVHVFCRDALKFDWSLLPAPFVLFGNLPYHIAGPLILESALFREKISLMVLMAQKEVAQRAMAKPGGKDYGLLSVAASLFWEARLVAEAAERDFYPAPKVKGRVLAFHPKKSCLISDPAAVLKFTKSCFSHRRKILLKRLPGVSFERAKEIFSDMGLDFQIRAEALSPEQILDLHCRCRSA